MATVNLGRIKFVWQGAYNGATAYVADDVVSYNGSSYICILASTGNLPTNTTYWSQMSSAGTNGTNGTDLTTTLTTQGDIVYRDASGLARLGAGTSGQVLTTQGSGANPQWSTVSSDYVKLATASTTNTATLSLDGYFSSTYLMYLYVVSLSPITNGHQIGMLFRQSNADITSGYYSANSYNKHSDVPGSNGRTNHDCMMINGYDTTSSAGGGYRAQVWLYNPLNTTKLKNVTVNSTYQTSDGYYVTDHSCGWYGSNANALSGVTFMTDQNGNITGTVTLYGIKS